MTEEDYIPKLEKIVGKSELPNPDDLKIYGNFLGSYKFGSSSMHFYELEGIPYCVDDSNYKSVEKIE